MSDMPMDDKKTNMPFGMSVRWWTVGFAIGYIALAVGSVLAFATIIGGMLAQIGFHLRERLPHRPETLSG